MKGADDARNLGRPRTFHFLSKESLVSLSKEKAERRYTQISIIGMACFVVLASWMIGFDLGVDPYVSILGGSGIALTIWHYRLHREERKLRKQTKRAIKDLHKMKDPVAEIEAINKKRENHG